MCTRSRAAMERQQVTQYAFNTINSNSNEKQIAQQDALRVLIKAANLAQARGIFSLQESYEICKAVQKFVPENQQTQILEPTQQVPSNYFRSLKLQ